MPQQDIGKNPWHRIIATPPESGASAGIVFEWSIWPIEAAPPHVSRRGRPAPMIK